MRDFEFKALWETGDRCFLLDLFFELGDFVSSRAVSSVLLFTFVCY